MNAQAQAIFDEGASGDRHVKLGGRELRLTHLEKPFWPEPGITKGELLRYYAQVAPVLLPHLQGRARLMLLLRIQPAASRAKEAGVPVRVQWTREDDVQHDYYNTVSTQWLSAGLDERGNVIA